MTQDPAELYPPELLEHGRRPRNAGRLEAPTHTARCTNPLCGDRVTVDLVVQAGVVAAVGYEARGCTVAVAAASLLSEAVAGSTAAEAVALGAAFVAAVRGEGEVPAALTPLAAAARFPARRRCATLAAEAMAQALSVP
jgi:nitrogen fixation NifU-like protein